ncbi:MAG: hypothetical protein ACKOZM_10970 [Flavobacteriales bacterium]
MNKILAALKSRWKWMVPTLVLLCVGFYFRYDIAEFSRKVLGIVLPENPRPLGVSTLDWCEHNYGEQISEIADEMDLPYEYLMALAVLECSGEKPAGQRFEPHVFKELMKVKNGKRRKYEMVKQSDLVSMDDDEIRALATSWGPFQLMGYKVFEIDISIEDLSNDEDACYHGARWIKKQYGSYLQQAKWKDAFHIHNTGKRFPLSGRPKTHSPYYVSDGLKYMKHFSRN